MKVNLLITPLNTLSYYPEINFNIGLKGIPNNLLQYLVYEMYEIIVLLCFAILIALLILGKIERHWLSLAILFVLIVTHTVNINDVVLFVDWDVLGLILAMSILTIYLEECGLMDMASQFILKHTSKSVFRTIFISSFIAGLVSIFLENVSVVLLFAPIVFRLCRAIGINPVEPLILMTLSANIAGSATMIGDPPAIITASAFKLTFIDFIIYDGKPSMFFFTLISMILAIAISSWNVLKSIKNTKMGIVEGFNNYNQVNVMKGSNRSFVIETTIFLLIKIVLLSIRNVIHIPLTIIALIAVGGISIARLLHHDLQSIKNAVKHGFEWKLIIFLVGVFTLSYAFQKHGIAERVGKTMYSLGMSSTLIVTSIIIWISVALSAVIDNVPYVVTMIPVIKTLSNMMSIDPVVLMWSLLLGTTLGGNLTYIGASANVTAVRILEKQGYRVSFQKFITISLIYNTIAVVSAWILFEFIYIIS